MKNKTHFPDIITSGLWGFPIGIIIAYVYAKFIAEPIAAWDPRLHPFGHYLKDWGYIIIIVLTPVVLLTLANIWRYIVNGEKEYRPVRKDKRELSSDKRAAQHHKVPSAYLSNEPDGLTIGECRDHLRKKYVRLPFFESPEHQMILGAPGARKSSVILNALLWNYNFASEKQKFTSVLAVDAKPELALKSVDIRRKDILIINPTSRDSWGFDVWHGLSQGSTDDEIKERAEMISRALIPTLSGDNIHFSSNAQKILSAFIMYGFRKHMGFAESITQIMHTSTKNLIAEILTDQDMRENHPKIIGKVKSFDGNDSDEFASIVDTLEMNLSIFDTDTVSYCFDGNPRKAAPEDLADGRSIYLAIPDTLVEMYKTVFGMIIELCCKHLMSLSEYDLNGKPIVWLLCDEAGSIYIPSLLDIAARGRSKHLQLTVICQDFPQLEDMYGRNKARSLMSCCKTKIILSCDDVDTAKDLSARTGEYRETKVSTHQEGYFAGYTGQNISSEYRPVMSVADINSLEKNNEVLVFAKEGWFLVDKITYKDIPMLEDASNHILASNLRRESESTQKYSSGVSYDKFL